MPKIIPEYCAYHQLSLPVVRTKYHAGQKKHLPIDPGWPDLKFETEDELKAHFEQPDTTGVALVLNLCELIDVECDSDEAEAHLQDFFGGKIPPTPTWQSKRGKHRLFLQPDGVVKASAKTIDGVEYRLGTNGKGTASTMPPTDGRTWVKGLRFGEVKPAELPANIVELLTVPTQPNTTSSITADSDVIPEGKRNSELFKRALVIRRLGVSDDQLLSMVQALNADLCDPPLEDAEVLVIAKSALTYDLSESKSDFVTGLLNDVFLFHSDEDEPFMRVLERDHYENWLIDAKSKMFTRWLSKRHYDLTKSPISAEKRKEVAGLLEGKAMFEGGRYKVYRRVGRHEGKMYLDLCDERWRAVEIDADGWCVIDQPPIKFRRAKAMQRLPEPVQGAGSLQEETKDFLNLDKEQWPLVMAWLLACFRPEGPYPILQLQGEQGSSKSTTARWLRSLIDPNVAAIRSAPKSTRDLMIASKNAWILCLDNLSSMNSELSDALCRLATGGGFATRTLYSNDDETIIDSQLPVIMTSIGSIGTRGDLLERSLLIELPSIPEEDRKPEKVLATAFDKAKPRILGALLDAVVVAIKQLPTVELDTESVLPRMADFAQWSMAAQDALGLRRGQFLELYGANRAKASQIVLEASPVVAALVDYVRGPRKNKDQPIEMLPTELFRLLKLSAAENGSVRLAEGWPKSAKGMTDILKRTAPDLRQIGITVEYVSVGRGDARRNKWRITTSPATTGK